MWTDGSLDGKIARLEGIRRAGLEPFGESTRYIWEQPSERLCCTLYSEIILLEMLFSTAKSYHLLHID